MFTRLISIFLIFCAVVVEAEIHQDEWPECDSKLLEGIYSLPHEKYCDRFYFCRNGSPFLYRCEDGFAYTPFRGCKLIHQVDCSQRPLLQAPKSTKDCPRLYGIYSDSRGCGRFLKCINGTAIPDRCAKDNVFDDDEKVCRKGTVEEIEACTLFNVQDFIKPTVLLGCKIGPNNYYESCTWFKCPTNDPLPFGDHSKHPFPGNCHHYIKCHKDGSIKVGICPVSTAFNMTTGKCESDLNALCM